MTRPDTTLAWCTAGEAFLAASVDAVTAWDAPTLLPGWSRRTLLAHVARNADALGNLLTWARTGVETSMYASADARAADIERSAAAAPGVIVTDYRDTAGRLAAAMVELPAPCWAAPVRTAQGREVAVSEVPWMRTREVWVHACDLRAADGLDGVPQDVLLALGADVGRLWSARSTAPSMTGRATDAPFRLAGPDGGPIIEGRLVAVVGWLTGRAPTDALSATGAVPDLPAWL